MCPGGPCPTLLLQPLAVLPLQTSLQRQSQCVHFMCLFSQEQTFVKMPFLSQNMHLKGAHISISFPAFLLSLTPPGVFLHSSSVQVSLSGVVDSSGTPNPGGSC